MLEGGNSSKMRIDSGNRKNQILIFFKIHERSNSKTESQEKETVLFFPAHLT